MPQKKFVAGSMGPYLYNDDDAYPSHYGDPFAGEYMQAFFSEGQGKILEAPTEDEHVVRLVDLAGAVPLGKITATSMSVVTGTLTSGTVTDTQVWNDGNEVNVTEAASTPGYDVQFTFDSLTDVKGILTSVFYDGASTHQVELQIYNYDTTSWETVTQIAFSLGYNLVSVVLPVDSADYMSSGEAKARFYHISAGNASHNIYINYIAILQ